MSVLRLESVAPWAPHPQAAPMTERNGDALAVATNGTQTCVGGWQVAFSGVVAGETYRIVWMATHRDVRHVRDSLRCKAYWGEMNPGSSQARASHVRAWEYLVPERGGDGLRFSRTLTAPEGTDQLTLRCTFRWSTTGEAVWGMPEIETGDAPGVPGPVKVAVVTGRQGARKGPFESAQDNIDFYLPLCEAACQAERPDLVVLPEIALHWGLPDHALDHAVAVPGDETGPFSDLARRYGTRILVGLHERDGDAVFNSAVLIGPDGAVEGCYRKVHLAVGGESESGICAGESFPVFHTDIGRIGCNICMDSSAAESCRMVGLNGADFLLLPIMGDHRADRWDPGQPVFSEDRWQAIMRTHAIDSQVCMVVARNNGPGSCVVDRKGDFLAWNGGDEDYVVAEVNLEDGYQTWNAGCFRGVNWMQRRPHVYGAFLEEGNVGGLG